MTIAQSKLPGQGRRRSPVPLPKLMAGGAGRRAPPADVDATVPPGHWWRRAAVAALLFALVAAGVVYGEVRRQAEMDGGRVVSASELSAEQAGRALEGAGLALRDLARRIETAWVYGRSPDASAEDILGGFSAERGKVRGVLVLDAAGRLLADSRDAAGGGAASLADRGVYLAHARGAAGALYIGEPVIDPSSGERSFALSRAITAPDGGFGGVAVAIVDSGYFRRFYDRQRPLGEVEVALVDVSGRVLAASTGFPGEPGRADRYVSEEAMALAYVDSGRSQHLPVDMAGTNAAVAAAPVPDFGLYALTAIPRSPDAWLWQRSTLAVIALWLAASLLAGFYFHLKDHQLRQEAAAREAADRAREAAEQANMAKSNFLAMMSHELRTPLNAIIGFSQIIRDQTFGEVGVAKYAEYAHDMHASAMHLLALINDILDISKIEAGRMALHVERLDLAREVGTCVNLLRERAHNRRQAVQLRLADDLPVIRADRRSIRQIVFNLLSNAINYTPKDGVITISLDRVPEAGVRLAVADTGVGIPEHMIEVVQRPFEQVDGNYSRSSGGTGLGLALVKGLVELHGGSLDLQSELGEGTTVTVTLPEDPNLPPMDELDDPDLTTPATH